MFVMDEKAREANRERQKKYREAHKNEVNEKRRERYNSRAEAGKCPRCGGKAKKGRVLCEKCCEYQGELNKKYAAERKKAASKTEATVKTKKAAPKPRQRRQKQAPQSRKRRRKQKPKNEHGRYRHGQKKSAKLIQDQHGFDIHLAFPPFPI